MTWGAFKRLIESAGRRQGDGEELRSISWNGLEKPVLTFETQRRGKETQDIIDIA